MPTVYVRFGDFKKEGAGKYSEKKVKAGTTAEELVKSLGRFIDVILVMANGEIRDSTYMIKEGDRLDLLDVSSGGA